MSPLLSISTYSVKSEPMISLKHRSLSMLLTPNHRCVVYMRGRGTEEVKYAMDLSSSDHILISANWNKGGISPISVDMASLIGWYLTEGYEQKQGSGIEIYQSLSANADKVKMIRDLLHRLKAEFQEATFGSDVQRKNKKTNYILYQRFYRSQN